MPAEETHHAIETVWRIESARLIAGLTRLVRDVGVAEELAQDALVAALEQWPASGVPQNPGAWLMAAAKRRAIDRIRREKLLDRKHERLARERAADQDAVAADLSEARDAALDDDVGDDLLRLIFMTCHPALSAEGRVALTLRLVGGLTTEEIARAFLTSETTIAQRIVRAKRTLNEKRVAFEAPRGAQRAARLASVLEVIYLIFNEGYTATSGSDWLRPGLCEEALRLGRVLAGLAPQEPEVHGLAALMEFQASRARARVGPNGEPVLLLDQNRALWDQLLIHRGLAALERAEALRRAASSAADRTSGTESRRYGDGGYQRSPSAETPRQRDEAERGEMSGTEPRRDGAAARGDASGTQGRLFAGAGPYVLQAAIAACHARARTAAETDWGRIVELYGELARAAPSPVVELNRAVAVAMASGPGAGLELVDALAAGGGLADYHLLPSVRGDLLFKLGRLAEAQAEFLRAAELTRNERERAFLRGRAAACGGRADGQ